MNFFFSIENFSTEIKKVTFVDMGCLKLDILEQNFTSLKVAHNDLTFNGNCCAGTYRFGFNGKENDIEVTGWQDYGMREYDTRIARFISVDPLTSKYPMLTPYQFASNSPIQAVDIDGLEGFFIRDYDYFCKLSGAGMLEPKTDKDIENLRNELHQGYLKGKVNIGDHGTDFLSVGTTWTTGMLYETDKGVPFNDKPTGNYPKTDQWYNNPLQGSTYNENEGSADGGNSGRITQEDVEVGLAVVGTIVTGGALLEATTIYGAVVGGLQLLNGVDDISAGFGNKQKFSENAAGNNQYAQGAFTVLKMGVSILSAQSSVSFANEAIRAGNAANATYSTIDAGLGTVLAAPPSDTRQDK